MPDQINVRVHLDRRYSITALHFTVHPPHPPVHHLPRSSLHRSVILEKQIIHGAQKITQSKQLSMVIHQKFKNSSYPLPQCPQPPLHFFSISLVCSVYNVYLPILSSFILPSPSHHSLLSSPWFLIAPCPLVSRQDGETGGRKKKKPRVEEEIVERRVTAAYGKVGRGFFPPLCFSNSLSNSPSHTVTHIAGVSVLLCPVMFP